MYRLVVRRHKDVIVGQMDLNDKIGWENNTNNTCIVGCAKEVHNAAQANISHKSEVVSGGKLNSQTQRRRALCGLIWIDTVEELWNDGITTVRPKWN